MVKRVRGEGRARAAFVGLSLLGITPATSCFLDRGERLDFGDYKGDARLWIDPDGGYHKPWLIFPEIRLDQPGDHEFTVTGLPRTSYGYKIGLALPLLRDDAQVARFARGGYRCEIVVTADKPGTLLVAGGMLEEATDAPAEREAADTANWRDDPLWIEGVRRSVYLPRTSRRHWFEPEPKLRYTIRFKVDCDPQALSDPLAPAPIVTPILWGAEDW